MNTLVSPKGRRPVSCFLLTGAVSYPVEFEIAVTFCTPFNKVSSEDDCIVKRGLESIAATWPLGFVWKVLMIWSGRVNWIVGSFGVSGAEGAPRRFAPFITVMALSIS